MLSNYFESFKMDVKNIIVALTKHKITIPFLVIITLFTFYPALDNDFVHWDDQDYVYENELISQPTWQNLKLLGRAVISHNYHPLTMASLWLNSYWFGADSAFSFCLFNILIHLANSLLVYYLIYLLFDRNIVISFIVSLLFAIHPMHIESVVWVSERKDVLYALFFLLASIYYIQYLKKEKNNLLFISLFLFVAACLSKAMAVAFFPIIYLYDYFSQRSFKSMKIHFEKIPFLIVAITFGLIALNVQSGNDLFGYLTTQDNSSTIPETASPSILKKLQFVGYGLYFYISKFIFPFQLSAFHPYTSIAGQKSLLIMPLFILAFISFVIWSFFNNRNLFFGLSFFTITIVLVLQIIPVGSAIVAERYTYLPYIGFALISGLLIQKLWTIGKEMLSIAIVVFSLFYFVSLSRIHVDSWQNSISLFENAVEQYPRDPFLRECLASVYQIDNQAEKSIYHLEYAINHLNYSKSLGLEILAGSYVQINNTYKAASLYAKAYERDPNNITALINNGILNVEMYPNDAINILTSCEKKANIKYLPKVYEARAKAYRLVKNFDLAIEDYDKAIKLVNNKSEYYFERGLTYEKMGLLNEAINDFKTVLSLNPNLFSAKEKLLQLSKLKSNV